MDFKEFSRINLARCEVGFRHNLNDWNAAEWTNAIAREAGEACNLSKKIIRIRDNLAGNIKPENKDIGNLKARLVAELADVIIYTDLAIQALGYSTSEIVPDTFNRKSEKLGLVHRIYSK